MQKRYLEIARSLQREIERGRFKPGALLPGRLELAKRFSVTRATIDRGIRFLMARGTLVSRQGAGTFVADAPPRFRIALVNGYPDSAHAPSPDGCTIEWVTSRAALTQGALNSFDGVIWNCPGLPEIDIARKLGADLPQIIINREMPDLNFVSTDHRGAIHGITAERLKHLPQAVPVFLSVPDISSNLPYLQRREGFVDACRSRSRFYEELALPFDFEGKIAALKQLQSQHPDKTLLVVSATMYHTGAVVAWRRESGLEWQHSLWYSDFDNECPECYWGVRVSSFVQDIPGLQATALEQMGNLLMGAESSVRMILPARRIDGQT